MTHLLYSEVEKPKMEGMLEVDLDSVARDPFMIHYTSEKKPWGPVCRHPYEDRFHDYLRQSGWFAPGGYAVWRAGLGVRRGLHTLKDVTRPLRHRVGMRRR